MKRLKVFLISSGIVFPLVLMVAGIITIDTQANPLKQDSCEAACACQNHDISRLNQEYSDLSKAPYCCDNDGHFYSFPSLCAEQWYYWQKYYGGGAVSDAQMNALYESFLSEKQSECDACQGSSNVVEETETPEPEIEPQPVLPTKTPGSKPTATPIPENLTPLVVIGQSDLPAGDSQPANTLRPYRGLAADGSSFLYIVLKNTDPKRKVVVNPGIPEMGDFTFLNGKSVWGGNIIIDPNSSTQILYTPPDYLPRDETLSESFPVTLADGTTQTLWAKKVPVEFEFYSDDGSSAIIQKEILVFRPPVVMVHGFFGSKETWTSLSKSLQSHRFLTVVKDYLPEPSKSTIELMSVQLKKDIHATFTGLRTQGYWVEKVDIVSHSMGGLISRNLVQNNPDLEFPSERDTRSGDIIRKILMLGTPNHGAYDWFDKARILGSYAEDTHTRAAHQLNYDDPFIIALNRGEDEGKHLNPNVEYANLVGQITCGSLPNEDGVVSHTSSHLNGVLDYHFEHTTHTGGGLLTAIRAVYDQKRHLSVPAWMTFRAIYDQTLFSECDKVENDISITENQDVFNEVYGLLLRAIPRDQFAGARIEVIKGRGEISLRAVEPDQPWQALNNFPTIVETYQHIRSSVESQAVIGLYQGEQKWAEVHLAPESEIVFGSSSPAEINIWMVKGKARFITSPQSSRQLKISVGQKQNQTWQTILPQAVVRDLDTDFIISVDKEIMVYTLQGQVDVQFIYSTPDNLANSTNFNMQSGKGVVIKSETDLQPVEQMPQAWWQDNFYPKKLTGDGGVAQLFNASKLQKIWVLIPIIICLGAALVLLAGGFFSKNKKIMLAGLAVSILTGIFVCLALVYYFIPTNVPLPGIQPQTDPIGSEQAREKTPVQPIQISTGDEVNPLMPSSSELAPAGQPFENNLSANGPWIVYTAEDGLWAANEDGSGLSHLIGDAILGPADLQAAISPDGARVAFITASDPDSPRDPVIFIVSLPDVNLHGILDLTIPEKVPMPDAAVCDPGLEAARAATIGNGLAWSPDGTKLAFSATLEGDNADVYLYSFDDRSTTRLTNEPGQAYDLHWSAEENKIVYFSANCFGTGGGFDMEGVYAVDPDTGGQKLVYRPDGQSYGEKFVDWLFTDRTKFMAATVSGCPYRDMRLVDINTGEMQMLFEGCFEDYAVGPTSMLAVITSRDMYDRPGVYLFPEPEYGFEPIHFPNENGRRILFEPGLMQFLIQNHEQGYKEILSVDLDGEQGWYVQRGEFPAFSKDGEYWVWETQGKFYLGGNNIDAPVELLDQTGQYPRWSEVFSGGDILQQLLFSGSTPPFRLYQLIPGYDLRVVGEGVNPVAAPVVVYP